jgi:hypothetical protein
MSARQISSPLGSSNRIALGGTEPWTLMLVTTLARIDLAAAKSGALNSPLPKTTKSRGDPRVARNSYFQRDLLRDNHHLARDELFSQFLLTLKATK